MHFIRLSPLLVLAAGCAPEEAAEPAPTTQADGWRIAPQGSSLNDFFDCLDAEGITLVSAHRGAAASGYPENAIETFERTMKLAPALIEIDVAQAADGVLFLLHDETLDRTTTGKGEASAISYDEISALRLEDGEGNATDFRPPRFSDVLTWAAGRTILQIDIKPSARYEDVAAEIKAQNAEARVFIITRSLAQAQKLHALLPHTMLSLDLNSMSDLNRAVAGGLSADTLLGFTGTTEPRPRLFDILGERNVEVVFGTLGRGDSIDAAIAASGDDAQYTEIAALGADIIATDRPAAAHSALAAAGKGARDGVCGVSRVGG